MKFLQKWGGGNELPTLEHNAVLLNEETKKITIKKGTPTPKVELVDLGLPSGLLWATCNVGATKPEEFGKYFQWGDTVGYEGDEALAHSTWATAPFNNGSSSFNETYFASVSGDVLTTKEGETYPVLKSQYDAATVAYGEGYRMPTDAEYKELTANTTSTWETVNGVNGRKFTSKTDSSKYIFIPATGFYYDGSFDYVGSNANVWSSSFISGYPNFAWGLYFNSGDMNVGISIRYNGFSVRAVSKN